MKSLVRNKLVVKKESFHKKTLIKNTGIFLHLKPDKQLILILLG